MKRTLTGLRAWLMQRVSAVCMLVFIILLLVHFLLDPPRGFRAWHDWVMNPVVSVAFAVFFAALSIHVWVGVRDVILDYVRPVALRIAALALLGSSLLAVAAWVARILLAGRA